MQQLDIVVLISAGMLDAPHVPKVSTIFFHSITRDDYKFLTLRSSDEDQNATTTL